MGGGVLGHGEVDDAPAMMGERDENEEDAQARGGIFSEQPRQINHVAPDGVLAMYGLSGH